MKKVMLDSNVVFSGLLYARKPSEILRFLRKRKLKLVMPTDELDEIRSVFGRRVSYKEYVIDIFLKIMKPEIISDKKYRRLIPDASKLARDEKDIPILACALAVKPEFFVTGDKDFHTKEVKREINVITPAEFLKKIESSREDSELL